LCAALAVVRDDGQDNFFAERARRIEHSKKGLAAIEGYCAAAFAENQHARSTCRHHERAVPEYPLKGRVPPQFGDGVEGIWKRVKRMFDPFIIQIPVELGDEKGTPRAREGGKLAVLGGVNRRAVAVADEIAGSRSVGACDVDIARVVSGNRDAFIVGDAFDGSTSFEDQSGVELDQLNVLAA